VSERQAMAAVMYGQGQITIAGSETLARIIREGEEI